MSPGLSGSRSGGVVAAAWLDAVVAVVPAEVLCVDPPQAASMTLTSTAASDRR